MNVYDVGDDDGLHYIVMELVEGITLKKFIERKGKLEVKEAIGIAIQIAQGMEAAHANHIIHRDIKPQNIIISKEGKVKVGDKEELVVNLVVNEEAIIKDLSANLQTKIKEKVKIAVDKDITFED